MGYSNCEEEAEIFARALLKHKYPRLALVGYLTIPMILLYGIKYFSIFYPYIV